jgi:hypothetical protein
LDYASDTLNDRPKRRLALMQNCMNPAPRRLGSILVAAFLAVLVGSALPAAGQALVKVNDNINFKLGILLQSQVDWQEVANATNDGSGGYQQNMLVRRVRFILGGQVAKDVFFYFDTENGNLGKTTVGGTGTGAKSLGTGFNLLDAVGEWRIAKEFNIQFGEILVPTNRWILTSSASTFMLDQSAYNNLYTAGTQSNTGRDTGFMIRGFLFCDRLEYRSLALSGFRAPGVKNSPRFTQWLQYNFFDTEVYNMPSYAGVNYGNKKILAIAGGYDLQSDYKMFSANMYLDFPIKAGSFESTIVYQYLNGGLLIPTLPEENTFSIEAGAFLRDFKFAPIARYEQRTFNQPANEYRNEHRYAVGLNYYPFPKTGNAFNIKFWWQRVDVSCAVNPGAGACPSGSRNFPTNEFTLQMQVAYF